MNIESALLININQLTNLFLQNLIRFIRFQKYIFFGRVGCTIIMTNTDTDLPLMNTTVHVTIDHKVHTALFIYIYNLNSMLIIPISDISILFPKAKDFGQAMLTAVIGKQLALLYKADCFGIFRTHILDIRICDT